MNARGTCARGHLHEGLSLRQVAASLQIPHTTVADHLRRSKAAGLSWPLPDGLDDDALEALLFAPPAPAATPRPLPDWDKIHLELRRPHVTLMLVWLEYRETFPDGYAYSQFCELYRRWHRHVDVVMRQEHKAGEKLFVDFPGRRIGVYDEATGQVAFEAELFVAVLGASSYLYAEALRSQELLHWVTGHVHAFESLGGCPAIVVCDNLRSGVTRPHRYEPDVNATYQDMAAHYGVAVIPARAYKPRDKPVVCGFDCPFERKCDSCEHFVITGADYGYWKRQEQRWAAMAEGVPDESSREYIYGAFERSSQALALAGLEKALLALGLLDDAKALDLRSPHQDSFNPVWSQGWRAGDLVEIGGGTKDVSGLPLSPEAADDEEERARIMSPTQHPGTRPRPERAIDARRREATTRVASVEKAVKLLGRTGAPITRAAVSHLAGVSRSFTFENDQARSIIGAAQARTQARAEVRPETLTAQQEASWRERALNAEEEVRKLRHELMTQRRLAGDLKGQLREPDGTWVGQDRERLRKENEVLCSERNQLLRERSELQRRLVGARANVSRLSERKVTELFPDGPGRKE